ncbi:Hypothetical protein D9617_26g078270 [Elsinoe fawcettii]|nr:Hypothetical protein D9617_26g078270 [Elsinoe fawcettii]
MHFSALLRFLTTLAALSPLVLAASALTELTSLIPSDTAASTRSTALAPFPFSTGSASTGSASTTASIPTSLGSMILTPTPTAKVMDPCNPPKGIKVDGYLKWQCDMKKELASASAQIQALQDAGEVTLITVLQIESCIMNLRPRRPRHDCPKNQCQCVA